MAGFSFFRLLRAKFKAKWQDIVPKPQISSKLKNQNSKFRFFRIWALLLLFCFFSVFFTFTAAIYAGEHIELYYNGNRLSSEIPSISQDNTLLAPLRQVSELFANFSYDMAGGIITLQKDTVTLELKLDSYQAKKNGKKYILAGKPALINEYVMVPLGFVCQAFGAELKWQAGDLKAYITKPQPKDAAITAAYAYEPIELYFNGSLQNSEPPVINHEGNLLAPSWLIWKILEVNIDDTPLSDSFFINDQIMASLDPICQALGAELAWPDGGSKAYITYLDTKLIAAPAMSKGLVQGKIPLPVLMYHNFSDNPDEVNSVTVSPQKFENDLTALKEAGYTTMLPHEVLEAYEGGYLPQKPILITIDDGYLSNYQLAFPVLVKLGMKATIFVVGSTIGRFTNAENTSYIRPHFNLEEAKDMNRSGLVSIQPHSYNLHFEENEELGQPRGMDRLREEEDEDYENRLFADTSAVKKIIEEEIGEKVISFSYPYGYYNKIADQILRNLGIEMTFTVERGLNLIANNDFFHLKRINVDNNLPYPKLISYLEDLRK
ncbi:MAG: polysaccharide deacetylase family protein [Clostridiales bacterium]|nr:polysaccharide deacetylase family protein [Clostridiales bacterium]